MKHVIVYIPGLIDKRAAAIWLQKQLFRSWMLFGNRVEIFRVGWAGNEQFKDRLDTLLGRIDELTEQGSTVSLIGASAGASAAINAYAKRPNAVNGVVCVCGALRGVESFPEVILTINPRFRESAKLLPKSIEALSADDRRRVLTLRPLFDGVVLPKNAMLDGAKNRRVWSVGHLVSIGYCLYGRSTLIWRFLRQKR